MSSGIDYSQCWEDSQVLRRALAITADDHVLSIASGGDNTLGLLLDGPRRITAIDHNPRQLFLVELKMQAMQSLDYDDFVGFVGARDGRHRQRLYRTLRGGLTPAARAYWDHNLRAIKRGIIHCGKFERYLAAFRRYVLPLAPGRSAVRATLAAASVDDQRRVFETRWNTARWQALFRLFFSRRVLGETGRTHGAFRHVPHGQVAEILQRRVNRAFTMSPIGDNFLLHYMLTGHYPDLETAHPYLSHAGFAQIKERLGDVTLVCANLTDYLNRQKPRTFSALNLSDVFEYMSSDAYERTMREVVRVASSGARMAFWTVFIPRTIPDSLKRQVVAVPPHPARHAAPDQGFFYGSFDVWHLNRRRPTVQPSPTRKVVAFNDADR